ncbi:mannose-specific lectin-like [Salarias fasciatus]|uniref:Mannose-specific lectin-like n=1 Tax=Salarias fasciatus TaxID=181472 RepID=A0A672IX59_SALFA|nr:mannose-specific lectin-like [Salarias fasciatus]
MSRNFLSTHEALFRGDYLLSNNREFKAIFQDDGNFVIYGWKPVWDSGTANTEGVRLCMQGDGNLVIYTRASKPVWHTNSYGDISNMCRLYLTDEGKLVVRRVFEEIWNSSNSRGKKST